MCLHPRPVDPVPEQSARVAHSAFSNGNPYMRMRDELGTIFEEDQFVRLFPERGKPAFSPWRLALATIMPFSENLSDRQAADAVRSRIDWNLYDVVKRRKRGRTPYRRAAWPIGH